MAEMSLDPDLEDALRSLSHAHYAVVLLVDLAGLSYAAAAGRLGIPVGTVMSRLHRGRRRMRARLHDISPTRSRSGSSIPTASSSGVERRSAP
jgi:RNA polymerase sigma-70 factor (ECF subfamily)